MIRLDSNPVDLEDPADTSDTMIDDVNKCTVDTDVNRPEDDESKLSRFDSLDPDSKLSTLFKHILSIEETNKEASKSFACLNLIERENAMLKVELLSAKGRIMRLESRVEQLMDRCEESEWRMMRQNLIFHNVRETEGEDCYKLVHDIMITDLKINSNDIYRRNNISGEIRVDVAHRIGVRGEKARPIVVKFVTLRGKELVAQHSKHLKGSRLSISDQLPYNMRERRAANVKKLIALKEEKPGVNAKLKRDKLLVNNKEQPSLFRQNPLTNLNDADLHKNLCDELKHTPVVEIKGNSFQAHATRLSSKEHGAKSLDALFQHAHVSRSTSLMYA